MNNDYLVERLNTQGESKLTRVPFLKEEVKSQEETLEALYTLKTSEAYLGAVEKLLKPRLERLTRKLRQESEPITLYRLQGKANELENFTDLDKWIRIEEEALKRSKQILKQENAEEKERNGGNS